MTFPCAWSFLTSSRLGCTSSLFQFATDLVQRNATFDQQHQEVINQIGGLGNKAAVGIFSGDNCFRRFFPDLLQNLVEPTVEQVGGITAFGPLFLSLRNDG